MVCAENNNENDVTSPFTIGRGSSNSSSSMKSTSSIENMGKRGQIATGQPFLDHMIDQLTTHAQLGVSVQVEKDNM